MVYMFPREYKVGYRLLVRADREGIRSIMYGPPYGWHGDQRPTLGSKRHECTPSPKEVNPDTFVMVFYSFLKALPRSIITGIQQRARRYRHDDCSRQRCQKFWV